MAYLIDSDWTIDHLAQDPTAQELFASLAPDGTFISIITYIEVFQGTLRRDDQATGVSRLQDFLVNSPILDLTMAIAERAARIRQHFLHLSQRPARRGFDIVIAATAIEHDLTLVTRNVGDYADIPGIKLYEASQT